MTSLIKYDEITDYRPWLPSPPKLVEYAGDRVNEIPMPHPCWDWSVEDVVNWLNTTVGLPEYEDCIRRNFITGRRLLLLETWGFPKIGIRDFSHTKRILATLRELFGVERTKESRSIGLPPRYPWTHYLMYRIPTGPTREGTTPFQLFTQMGIIQKGEPCPFGHWEMIVPTQPDFPCNRFGRVLRKCVYRRSEHPRQPRGHSFYKKSKTRDNYFVRVDIK